MAGPTTETLDPDLKDLRVGFRRLALIVASSVGSLERSVDASIARVEIAQAKQEVLLVVLRAIVLCTAGAAITGIFATVLSAGDTSSKLDALQSQFDRLDTRVRSQFGRLENRLDRIESSINRLAPKAEAPRFDLPNN